MFKNPAREVRKISDFLELDHKITDEYIDHVVQQSSFSNMKENSTILPFLCRKGLQKLLKNFFQNIKMHF